MLKFTAPDVIAFFCICAACVLPAGETHAASRIVVTSPSFSEGEMMPERHAYDKDNASPALAWSGIPDGAKSIALICEDPDAPSGNWVHWVIFNIPPSAGGLPEGVPMAEALDDGSLQGTNDFRKIGYDGPYPPYGTHRYVFKVYAIDAGLELQPGASRSDIMRAIQGHVVGYGALTGRYKRRIDTPKTDVIE